ncbi:MAG: hypothetical protein SGJ19_01485, partial [Planctomycetia bacterium]|nr:hypothetical protein [Planctomycetia bacterium]
TERSTGTRPARQFAADVHGVAGMKLEQIEEVLLATARLTNHRNFVVVGSGRYWARCLSRRNAWSRRLTLIFS